MAKYTDGVMGPFVGNVGTVTGSTWKGVPYMKSRNKTRTKKVSEKEKLNRNKFTMAHFWLQPILEFVKVGFRNHSFRSWGFNAAKSSLLKNAFEGEGAEAKINPALVKVSAGNLPLPTGITVEKTGEEEIRFTWDTDTKSSNKLDNVMLLAYTIEGKTRPMKTIGEFRDKGTDTLSVVKGHTYHLYLAFNASDRNSQSDSVYLGEMSM